MTKKIYISAGHGGFSYSGAVGHGLIEKNETLSIALKARDYLSEYDCEIMMARTTDVTTLIDNRVAQTKNWCADLLIDLHYNAFNRTVRGFETFRSANCNPKTPNYQKIIHEAIYDVLKGKTPDRGQKVGNYRILNGEAQIPSVLIEYLFIDEANDNKLIRPLMDDLAKATVDGVVKCLGLKKKGGGNDVSKLTSLFGQNEATLNQAKAYIARVNPKMAFIADYFYDICKDYKNEQGQPIRADIAVCQAYHETDGFRYSGIVKEWQNNTAGIGATGIVCDGNTVLRGADPNHVSFKKGVHGAIFSSWKVGVEAQIQHIWAYSTKLPLPAGKTLYSPRFTLVNRGSAKYMEHLGAGENPTEVGWAYPGLDYGSVRLKLHLDRMKKMPDSNPTPIPPVIPPIQPPTECNECKRLNNIIKSKDDEIRIANLNLGESERKLNNIKQSMRNIYLEVIKYN